MEKLKLAGIALSGMFFMGGAMAADSMVSEKSFAIMNGTPELT